MSQLESIKKMLDQTFLAVSFTVIRILIQKNCAITFSK